MEFSHVLNSFSSFIFRQILPFCLAHPTPFSACLTSHSGLECYPSGWSSLAPQYKAVISATSNGPSPSHSLLLFSTADVTAQSHLFLLSLYSYNCDPLPKECQVHESRNDVHLAHGCIPISSHTAPAPDRYTAHGQMWGEGERGVREGDTLAQTYRQMEYN